MRERNFLKGLDELKIPYSEALQIQNEFYKDNFPKNILEIILKGSDSIANIHPDNYPWPSDTFDELISGFEEFDRDKIWSGIEQYIQSTEQNLPLPRPSSGEVADAIVNLLEMYALINYTDSSGLESSECRY
jgi:hypothetical protein